MSRGGMQSEGFSKIFCKCGKEAVRIKFTPNEEISMHWGKKRTLWHIYNIHTKEIKRTFTRPEGWGK